MESLIQSSACLSFAQKGNQLEAVHRLNGRRYLLTPQVKALLDSCQEPITRTSIVQQWSQEHQPEEVDRIISYLLDRELLIENGADETFSIAEGNQRLYGFGQYQPATAAAGQVTFCGIPWGQGNGSNDGSKTFPFEIRQYLATLQARFSETTPASLFRFISTKEDFSVLAEGCRTQRYKDWGDLYINRFEYPDRIYRKIYTAAAQLLQKKQVPFFLGGDHSISLPLLQAVSASVPAFQVVQFDAHTDTYEGEHEELYKGRSVHHHGNFMRHALALDNLVGVHQLGIRGIFNRASETLPKQHIYWADQMEDIASGKTALALQPGIPVYITFDIDFFDPAIAPGTATPVINGAQFEPARQILQRIGRSHQIIGADLVEVNPGRDEHFKTMQLASLMILLLLNQIN